MRNIDFARPIESSCLQRCNGGRQGQISTFRVLLVVFFFFLLNVYMCRLRRGTWRLLILVRLLFQGDVCPSLGRFVTVPTTCLLSSVLCLLFLECSVRFNTLGRGERFMICRDSLILTCVLNRVSSGRKPRGSEMWSAMSAIGTVLIQP